MTETTDKTALVDTARPAVRAYVLHPVAKSDSLAVARADDRLQEAHGLALAIRLHVVHCDIVSMVRPTPATLIGKGQAEEMGQRLKADDIELVVMDGTLTPAQQRNLERVWKCKVIDRTALILEIFGDRARTAEGRLQVELAHLSYQRSRLVRSWTHLERQRGGAGFLGGPGERQIELDRRLIDDRIARLREQLEVVRKRRGLQRKNRLDEPFPMVALVGYTNAGKSTLFNMLTGETVMAKDLLFATLDPTMRALELPSGLKIILSDTVGFISDLPTQLVAAFRATLEEVTGADILVHVRDIARDGSADQAASVYSILADMGIGDGQGPTIVEVWNKVDQIDGDDLVAVEQRQQNSKQPTFMLSALTGQGTASLLQALDQHLTRDFTAVDLVIDHADGQDIAWLYDHGDVQARHDANDGVHLTVRLSAKNLARFRGRTA